MLEGQKNKGAKIGLPHEEVFTPSRGKSFFLT